MKKTAQLFAIGVIVFFSVGCAGVGIPNSTDPSEKVTYAFQAMELGRFVPAKKLLSESVEIYKERIETSKEIEDYLGLARAYKGFAVFHGSDPRKFPNSIGLEYDLVKARKYTKKAIDIYDDAGESNGSAQAYFQLAFFYSYPNQEACKYFDIALEKFDPNGGKFPISPQFKDFPEWVNAYKEKLCKDVSTSTTVADEPDTASPGVALTSTTQQPQIQNPEVVTDFNLTGTYISKVTSTRASGPRTWGTMSDKEEFKIRLEQSNNIISGETLQSKKAVIEGTLKDRTIKIKWYRGACGDGTGELAVSEDGRSLQGTWECKQYSVDGVWTLERI